MERCLMGCCGKKRAVASSHAIQNFRLNKQAKKAKANVCQELEKAGKNITILVKGGVPRLSGHFPEKLPASSSLATMGCAGTTARLIRSLEVEMLAIFNEPRRRVIFEKALKSDTVKLEELERVIKLCK